MATSQKIPSRLARILILLLLVISPLLLFWQRNSLYDAWRLHGYQVPAQVASLADDTKMTDSARHIFYVNHPQLMADSQTFRQACTTTEQTIVLGCYHGPEAGIYIYQVKDARLSGVQQVTAAHEMLHAAYERLSANDRNYINKLLTDYYNTGLTDQRIKDTIESYKKTEPKSLVDEMHSIFGTEIASLPKPLEDYYKRYFSDRTAVTNLSAGYEAEFTSRESVVKNLEDQLQTLQDKIKSEESSLKAEYSQINAQRAQLDSYRSSGQTGAYNSAVDQFNALVDDYNAKVRSYQADVARYNQLVNQYNQTAGDLRSLYNSINANVQTTDGQ